MADPTLLDGLKVVSMAEQFPGPFATMLLADMGAEIIMVERPDTGDPSRIFRPFFEALNRGKKSVTLDIKQADDRAKLLFLIKDADIFLEGFRPGKLAKEGLGYDALSAINPRLIYASISGYGQSGPYMNRPGHDITYQGIGGALFERLQAGVPGQPPDILLGDLGSAMFATIGVLAALEARHRTGRGTYIDVAMSDTMASLMTTHIALACNGGADLDGPPSEPGYDLFQTQDGKWLTISIAHEDSYWKKLCITLSLNEYADLPRSERVEKRAILNAIVRNKIQREPYSYWEKILIASDQMFGPAYNLDEVPSDPHLAFRGLIETITLPDGQKQTVIRQPLKFSGFVNAPITPSPALGADNATVFPE